ncbi:hypothetical protein MRX96_043203 [Rhipicephalus microplus]
MGGALGSLTRGVSPSEDVEKTQYELAESSARTIHSGKCSTTCKSKRHGVHAPDPRGDTHSTILSRPLEKKLISLKTNLFIQKSTPSPQRRRCSLPAAQRTYTTATAPFATAAASYLCNPPPLLAYCITIGSDESHVANVVRKRAARRREKREKRDARERAQG